MTDDPDIRIASVLIDYIFRRLAVDYLSLEERAELNILTTGERTQPTLPGVEETVIETRQGSDIRPIRRRSTRRRRCCQHTTRRGSRACSSVPGSPTRRRRSPTPQCTRRHVARRALLHAVRRADAAGRQLPRLPQLRQHQRLQLTVPEPPHVTRG